MDDCSCLTKLFPLKNLSCAFANITDGSGGFLLPVLKSTVCEFGGKLIEAKDILCKNICVCRVDGNILALALNMDKRTGKAVLAVVVSVAKILRANERSQLLASGSNAY